MSYIAILVLTLTSTSLAIFCNAALNFKDLVIALGMGTISLVGLHFSSDWHLVFQSLFIIFFTVNAMFLSILLAAKLSHWKAGG